MRVAILNGVNLDMLGRRDPEQYGTMTLAELEQRIAGWAAELGIEAACSQTNFEGAYVELIHAACGDADGLVLNPGAWTHYSYAIRDALEIFTGPKAEVHLSAIEQREEWRRTSVIADVVGHRISGRGAEGYRDALGLLKEETA
jgi:3-dehydroquinate dehydratase-2